MSDIPAKKKLRSEDNIFLIKNSTHQIVGAKLPSNRQVLQVFFYNKKTIGFDVNQSSALVVDEIVVFWQKARIPTSAKWYCITKVTKLYEKWKNLQKSATRRSELQEKRENEFVEMLDDLFDIAAEQNSDAMENISNETKEFLIAQRKKGREGCLLGVDVKGQKKEERKQERAEAEEKRRRKAETDKETYAMVSYDYGSDDDVPGDSIEEEEYVPQPTKKSEKKRKNIFTPRLIGALDKGKISDGIAIHVISAILKALELDINDYILSHSSLRVHRMKQREKIFTDFLQNVEVI